MHVNTLFSAPGIGPSSRVEESASLFKHACVVTGPGPLNVSVVVEGTLYQDVPPNEGWIEIASFTATAPGIYDVEPGYEAFVAIRHRAIAISAGASARVLSLGRRGGF